MSRRTVAYLKCDYCGREQQEPDYQYRNLRAMPEGYYAPRCPDLPVAVTFVNKAEYDADAPDMYEALEALTALAEKNIYPQPDKPNSDWQKVKNAQDALAKARGEPQ